MENVISGNRWQPGVDARSRQAQFRLGQVIGCRDRENGSSSIAAPTLSDTGYLRFPARRLMHVFICFCS